MKIYEAEIKLPDGATLQRSLPAPSPEAALQRLKAKFPPGAAIAILGCRDQTPDETAEAASLRAAPPVDLQQLKTSVVRRRRAGLGLIILLPALAAPIAARLLAQSHLILDALALILALVGLFLILASRHQRPPAPAKRRFDR